MKGRWIFLVLVVGVLPTHVHAQWVVRSSDPQARRVDVTGARIPDVEALDGVRVMSHEPAPAPAAVTTQIEAVVRRGQSLPSGHVGTLVTGAGANPASMDSSGRIAFFSEVAGSARNQGIFWSDGQQLKVIAMGCGQGGGSGSSATCGDPSPIGGTFSGMFLGSSLAPASNDHGDVLFMSDVAGGTAPRGLFLYRAATADIVKVAAVGDASPLGGTLSAIGAGGINNSRVVVFLASTGGDGSQGSDVLRWDDGVVTKYAAVGDAAPDGGTFQFIGTTAAGYSDGTFIPVGPVPAINHANQIAFFGVTQSTRGVLLSQGGTHVWQVRSGEPAPGGGFYFDFPGAPLLNANGKLAFIAYVAASAGGPGSFAAWFAGSGNGYRRALAHFDPVLDGEVHILAFSINPFRPLDDEGNLAVWATRRIAEDTFRETMLISYSDGTLGVLANQGDTTPIGGTYVSFSRWPTANDASHVHFGADVVDSPIASDAHFVATLAPGAVFGDDFESPQ